MATKIKDTFHGSNTLSTITGSEIEELPGVEKDHVALLSDQRVHKENMAHYAEVTRDFERAYEREQILMMSREHQNVMFRGWLLGEMLKIKKQQIEDGESDFASWNDMFAKRGKEIGFTRQAADNYLKLNANFTIEEYERLGTRVCLELMKIKDEQQREKTKKAFIKTPPVTVEAAKKTVEETISRVVAKAREAAEEKKEEAFDEVKYTLVKAGPTDILFRIDRKYIEAAQNVLLAEEARLKVKILDEYKRLTGR